MIRYGLACEHGHEFEGWFGSSADYDAQSERGLIACPVCDSRAVAKQIMAPAVAGTKKTAVPDVSRLSEPFRSAMSMLTFYINRAGSKLPPERKRTLEQAKDELRRLFGREPHHH